MKPVRSSFSVIAVTVLLVIIGCCCISFFSIQRSPSDKTKGLSVFFSWQGALAEVVEREVTSKLEGLASTLKGVKEITSISSYGQGNLNIILDKHTNAKIAKFELTSLIRSAYKNFPEGVSMPYVNEMGIRSVKNDHETILTYAIVGNGSSYYIKKEAESVLLTPLNDIEGVYSAELWGASPYELQLIVNKEQLKNHQLTTADIGTALHSYFNSAELGNTFEFDSTGNYATLFAELKGESKNEVAWEKIPLKKLGTRIVHLGDIAEAKYREQQLNGVRRFNGLNVVSLAISAKPGVNQILLAKKIREKITLLEKEFPAGFSLLLQQDATVEVKKEVDTIVLRVLLSIFFLLLFTLVISQSFRYLLLVTVSLIVNLCIAFVFYYLIDIDIHTYSLAGITISFGIMIDNVIIMIDHLRYKRNMKVFLAILAATLTTVGSLCVIFFLDEQTRQLLNDFALIIIINILVSLAVAFFVVPALLDVYPLHGERKEGFFRRKRRLVRWNRIYGNLITFNLRYRKWWLAVAILGFGIPVFLLPARLTGDNWYAGVYNEILGSKLYRKIKPYTEKALGGSLRFFVERDLSKGGVPAQGGGMAPGNSHNKSTKINVAITMPDGASMEELDGISWKFENHLLQYKEVASFETSVSGGEQASIQVSFHNNIENGNFPQQLKNELIDLANNTGGCDVRIDGVGKGFSNSLGNDILSSGITVSGYNYDAVLLYAHKTLEYLQRQPRVDKEQVNTGQRMYAGKVRYEYEMGLQQKELIWQNISPQKLVSGLRFMTFKQQNIATTLYDGQYIPVKMYAEGSDGADSWMLNNALQQTSRLAHVGTLEKKPSGGHITRRNQEYEVSVDYNFIGNYRLAEKVQNGVIDSMNVQLPIGFKAKPKEGYGYFQQVKDSQYKLVFLVIAIIFLICAVLLESLRQAVIIVLMVPLSFIGIFLAFSVFGFGFDQGGYAAFLLISGLAVNAALYIFNDYNNYKRQGQLWVKSYLRAYNGKIVPILLTVVSTVVSFLPFLLTVPDEPFWDALAAGTIGGLLFSIPILIVFLPLFLLWDQKGKAKDLPLKLSKN